MIKLFAMVQLGNPLIDDYHDNIGTHEYWWNHGLISDSTYEDLKKSCTNDTFLFPKNECYFALEQAYSEFGDINPYSIFSSPCLYTSTNLSQLVSSWITQFCFLFQSVQLLLLLLKYSIFAIKFINFDPQFTKLFNFVLIVHLIYLFVVLLLNTNLYFIFS